MSREVRLLRVTAPDSGNQVDIPLIPATTDQTSRVFSRFHITITSQSSSTDPIVWALVVVPEGYSPLTIGLPTGNNSVDMYSAGQLVLGCGLVDGDTLGNMARLGCRGTILRSGDSIHLLVRNLSGTTDGDVYLMSFRYSTRYG
jgi:hypothetical protein